MSGIEKYFEAVFDGIGELLSAAADAARRAHERHEEERRRRQEETRADAREECRRAIAAKREDVESSYKRAKNASEKFDRRMFDASIGALKGYNVSKLKERADGLAAKVGAAAAEVRSEYTDKKRRVEEIAKGFGENLSTQEYQRIQRELRGVHRSFEGGGIPEEEIAAFDAELKEMARSVTLLKQAEEALARIERSGAVGAIAARAEAELHNTPIASLADLKELVERVNAMLEETKKLRQDEKTAAQIESISKAIALVKSSLPNAVYSVEETGEALSFKNKIEEVAGAAAEVYAQIASAPFSVCTEERLKEVNGLIGRVLSGGADSAEELAMMTSVLNEGIVYLNEDSQHEDEYEDYLKKVDELVTLGGDVSAAGAFDPNNYQAQQRELNKLLAKADMAVLGEQTVETFASACAAMEEQGYCLLTSNTGEGADSAVAEAVFVKPGCEGVVWQVVVCGTSVLRRVIGVERTDGSRTTVARVKEVAAICEAEGECSQYLDVYERMTDGTAAVGDAVDSDTEGSDYVIAENGCVALNGETEAAYDELLASEGEEAYAKWRTKAATGGEVVGGEVDICKRRREEVYTQKLAERAKKQ